MARLKAFLIHLTASITIFLLFLGIVFFIWYPAPHHKIDGGLHILTIMAGVDIILGPLLTLILFKPGKWGLKFDMTCIIIMQLAALVYGATTIYQQRPAFMVFAVDRFVSIPAADIAFEKLQHPELERRISIGPLMAIAEFPEDREERQKMMFDVILDGQKDLEFRADLYKPYKPDLKTLQERNIDIPHMMMLDEKAKLAVNAFIEKEGGSLDDYFFLPLRGRKKDIIMVLSAKNGMPKGWIDVSPWLSDYSSKTMKKEASSASPEPLNTQQESHKEDTP